MERTEPPRADDVAAAYWAAWRAPGDYTRSWAWHVLDDAITSGDADTSVPVLQALWRQAQADDERRWVGECLQDVLHLAPHRTPARVVAAAAEDTGFAAAVQLVRVADLPAKAQEALAVIGEW